MLAAMPNDSVEILALPDGPAPVRWRRSRRARRVSLRIDAKGGSVIVTLPLRVGRAIGMALLVEHSGWVSQRLRALPGQIVFADGASLSLHGRPHVIRHVAAARAAVVARDGEILVSGEATFLPRRVADFLRAEAKRTLAPLAIEKAARIGAKPARISFKDTSSRWGSCSSRGNLAFSWRLVMAPGFVQDYVVAHEVAHLRHMNHSPRFWAEVAGLTPHAEAANAWLRREGLQLLRVG
jgi:predicted metal-dependent hydrolase